MILIIAANYAGYLHFVEQWGLSRRNTQFISSVEQLRGYENRLVLFAPAWWIGHGGSQFEKSMDAEGIDVQRLRSYFPRLKFIEVL